MEEYEVENLPRTQAKRSEDSNILLILMLSD